MKKFFAGVVLLLMQVLMADASTSQLKKSRDIASKTYSLEQYKELPKDKKYNGKLILTKDNLTGLEFNRPVFHTYKLKVPIENIVDILKDKEFRKAYPFLDNEVVKVLD